MFRYKIFRTTSFRLVLIASTAFSIALLIFLFLVISVTTTILIRQNDLTVQGEIKELLNDAHSKDLSKIAQTVERMSANSPQYFYVLQNRAGDYLAGNLPAIVPIQGVREWDGKPLGSDEFVHLRAFGLQIVDEAYLFVGVRAYKPSKMYGPVTRSFLWLMVPTFIAVLLGGLFISNRMLARVEAISQTSREIMSGDLKRRMPVSATDDEFDHLATSVNVMLDRIEGLMEGLRQVSNDIAHDLRTPLTKLRQRLELARHKSKTLDEFRDALDQSINHVDATLAIFAGLLRIAQIEAGTRKSGFKKLDLASILSEVVEFYKPVFEEKAQSLVINITPELIMAGDKELLTQLFVNLFDNATHHTPPQSTIKMRALIKDTHIMVELSDNGPGIPQAQTEKVMQRFYRLEQSRTTSGHGLGLSLVKAITEQHNGGIHLLDNHPGLLIKIQFDYCPWHLPLPLS